MTSLLARARDPAQVSASECVLQELLERQSGQMPFGAWLPWAGPGRAVDGGDAEGSGPHHPTK